MVDVPVVVRGDDETEKLVRSLLLPYLPPVIQQNIAGGDDSPFARIIRREAAPGE